MCTIIRTARFVTALTLGAVLPALPQAPAVRPQESNAAKIARALRAAPPSISADARVVDIDGTLLRQGTNGWTSRPGMSAEDVSPNCDDQVWVKLLAALDAKTGLNTAQVGIGYMIAGDATAGSNTDPFALKPAPGDAWVREGPHIMIVLPDPKLLTGISTDPNNGGPYVMWQGTPYAHLMVPVGPRPKQR